MCLNVLVTAKLVGLKLVWLMSNVARGWCRSRVHAAVAHPTITMLATLTLAAATIELTSDNFDKEVFESGKAAFVKFLARMLTGGRTRCLGKAAPCANVLISLPGASSMVRPLQVHEARLGRPR